MIGSHVDVVGNVYPASSMSLIIIPMVLCLTSTRICSTSTLSSPSEKSLTASVSIEVSQHDSKMLVSPKTFSKTRTRGFACLNARTVSGQRWRSSSLPFLDPAVLNGWHGNPPVIMSTEPLYFVKSVVLMSPCPSAFGK